MASASLLRKTPVSRSKRTAGGQRPTAELRDDESTDLSIVQSPADMKFPIHLRHG